MLIFDEGVDTIWSLDSEMQIRNLWSFVRKIRKIPEYMREEYVRLLTELKCFYVVDEDYMLVRFGDEISESKYGVYTEYSDCNYSRKLVFPIRGLDGEIKSLCAYDNGNEVDLEIANKMAKYCYSPLAIWKKTNYCFISSLELIKAVKDGYVFIVDGLCDKLTLTALGYNAVSLMGSELSPIVVLILSFIKVKIVLPDNDSAGNKLYKKCIRKLQNVLLFRQSTEWDIDDFLKNEEGALLFSEAFKDLMELGFTFHNAKVGRAIQSPTIIKK